MMLVSGTPFFRSKEIACTAEFPEEITTAHINLKKSIKNHTIRDSQTDI